MVSSEGDSKMCKWITNFSKHGRKRSPEAVMNFALCNAIAEGLAFTALDCFGIKGKTITHNYKD